MSTFDTIFLLDDISPAKPVTKALPSIQKAISKLKEYSSIPSYGLDVGLDELVIHQISQTQETSLGNPAGFDHKPTYGLDSLAEFEFALAQEHISRLTLEIALAQKHLFRLTLEIALAQEHSSWLTLEIALAQEHISSLTLAIALAQEHLFRLTRRYPKPSYGLDLRPDELATHGFAQTQETFLGYITGTGHHPSRSYEVDGGLVKPTSLRFADDGLVKPVTKALPWIQETISKNIWDYLSILSYGLDVGPVKPMRKTTLKDFGDYPSIPSHELDVAPVKSVTFAWIQEIIFKNIGDYPSIPSHKLDVGLVKTLTNVFAWIEGGIDAIDNIVSLFHWYVARPAPGFLA